MGYAGDSCQGMQQARCPRCNVPLDAVTPHADGCEYAIHQARMAQNVSMDEQTARYGTAMMNAHWGRDVPAEKPAPKPLKWWQKMGLKWWKQ